MKENISIEKGGMWILNHIGSELQIRTSFFTSDVLILIKKINYNKNKKG